ncbi:hypothetical protein [Natrinema halophilum]|uniref:DUF7978 domain-containing protein n=1 Tax=Natrinema halophilum TaxID=1699371 RepID=A0A7D5H3I4_9EURY|nr:hypothetical protein [Natrinema halophilum]QLG49871.1 hypothetical protein HYG82_13895 [Natrinema halophilum]
MSSERRFEYEKGPSLTNEQETDDSDSEDGVDGDPDDTNQRERTRLVVQPWKAGTVSGVSAFVVVFTVLYNFVGAMVAGGLFNGPENKPSRWVVTGLMTLGNHGVTIEQGEETIQGAFGLGRGLTSHVTALVPVVVLLTAGYLLVRHVRLETRREVGFALGSLVMSYIILLIGLAMTAQWTPEQASSTTEGGATIAAATDLGTVVSVGTTALVFVAIGATVAALPQIRAAKR